MIFLKKGEKADLTKNNPGLHRIVVGLGWQADTSSGAGYDLDASVFLLGDSGKCLGDEDIVFYGNPQGRNDAVVHSGDNRTGAADAERIQVELDKIPADIERLAFTITIHEAEQRNQNFGQIANAYVRVADQASNAELLRFDLGKEFSRETAVIAAEIYRHKGEWKFSAVGSGYFGGLAALCKHFGLEVEEETAPPQEATPTRIDLLKKKASIVLAKQNIANVRARVAMVMDASGSMNKLYKTGTVQRAFERVLAVAECLDDDGNLDVWFFSSTFIRAPLANKSNFADYVQIYSSSKFFPERGRANNEPVVMRDIIKKYVEEDPIPGIPVYVIFFSDGGVHLDKEIARLVTQSASMPIFWQFVGMGNANYGILKKLDTLPGRLVDNAGFFALDDLDKISDEELYNRLLSEFPLWLKEANNKQIIGFVRSTAIFTQTTSTITVGRG